MSRDATVLKISQIGLISSSHQEKPLFQISSLWVLKIWYQIVLRRLTDERTYKWTEWKICTKSFVFPVHPIAKLHSFFVILRPKLVQKCWEPIGEILIHSITSLIQDKEGKKAENKEMVRNNKYCLFRLFQIEFRKPTHCYIQRIHNFFVAIPIVFVIRLNCNFSVHGHCETISSYTILHELSLENGTNK